MLGATLLVGSGAAAQSPLPPWTDPGFPAWAHSVHVLAGDEPLLAAPRGDAARRGSASREARLPLYGAAAGPGCRGSWLHVGPQAWLCQDSVALSGDMPLPVGPGEIGVASLGLDAVTGRPSCPPPGAPSPSPASPWPGTSCVHFGVQPSVDGLPFRYFFVGTDGSLAYQQAEQVDVGEPAMTLEHGFAVAIVEQREISGEHYGRTNHGLWVPMRDLGPARPLAFEGSPVGPLVAGTIPVGWVVVDRAPLYARQGKLFVPTGRTKERFDRVAVLERAPSFLGGYGRIDDTSWIGLRSIRQPTLAPPPPEIDSDADERWIDIELASQTLVAYEGRRPVFATLVSAGRGKPGSPIATPLGTHRIWVKLLSSDMDNLEDDSASRYYRIEDVPWVQYFDKGAGLHAAFWHRSFGHPHSHGCVNLAPLDAERLFWWTAPRLLNGWTAALPSLRDRGAVVRVR
jgi:lipoprotein-anchoring transpeptidase ErfK/SrfK